MNIKRLPSYSIYKMGFHLLLQGLYFALFDYKKSLSDVELITCDLMDFFTDEH